MRWPSLMKFRWSVTPPEAGPGPELCLVCNTQEHRQPSTFLRIVSPNEHNQLCKLWIRPLLCLSLWAGLCAEEIHICGEPAAIDFIRELMYTTGEEVEVGLGPAAQQNHIIFFWLWRYHSLFSALLWQVHTYQRLTPFTVLDQAVESLDNLRPGDCIVCFSKNDIYSISRQIEARGLECAVIYGSLPPGECSRPSRLSTFALRQHGNGETNLVTVSLPGTKLSQAKKFNDPDDPCKILVATDAIGMGLNL